MSRASFTRIPQEMVDMIIKCLMDTDSNASLAALAQTCRWCYESVSNDRVLWADVVNRQPLLLGWACRYGRLNTVERLVKAGARLDEWLEWKMPGRSIVANNFRPTWNLVLKPSQLFPLNTRRQSVGGPCNIGQAMALPIHLAILSGNVDLVKYITQASETANTDTQHFCPCIYDILNDANLYHAPPTVHNLDCVHMAICTGHGDIAKYLLLQAQDGISLSTTYLAIAEHQSLARYTCSPALLAAKTGLDELMTWIAGWKTAASETGTKYLVHQELDGQGLPAIWHAYLNDHWTVIDSLVESGASLDDDLSRGFTPLVHACLHQRPKELRELLVRGADSETVFHSRPTNYMFKATPGSCHPDGSPFRGLRPIDICVIWQPPGVEVSPETRFKAVCRRTRAREVVWRPAFKNGAQGEAEHKATEADRRLMVQTLASARANIGANPASISRIPPLVAAAADHNSGLIRELLQCGAAVNEADPRGVTAIVALFGYERSSCPFHVDEEDKPYTIPDHRLPDCRELQTCVQLLLDHGANVEPRPGDSALYRLVLPAALRQVYMKDNRGWRIEAGDRTAVAQALLNHGADPNSRASVLLPPCPAPESWMVRSGPPANPAEDLSSRWPLSPLQHAFLAGDFQLCKLLVTTPRTSTPDREIAWMYEVMMYCIMNTKQSIAPVIRRADAVDVITILTGPLGGSPIADAVCLAWTLAVLAKENCSGLFSSIKLETQGKPDCYCLRNHPESHGARACYGIKKEYLVQAARMIISQPAFDAGKLSLTLDATRWNKRYGTTPVQLGTVCLEEAILAGQQDIVLKLLNMKCEGMLRVEALRLAVTMATANNSSLPILETLLLHGAPLHVQEDETNHDLASPHGLRRHQSCVHLHGVGYALDDALTNLATWKTGLPCRNPLLYAICLGNKEAVGLMLRFYFTYSAPDASLTRLYVREACVRLDHAMLAVLLDFEPMRQVCLENGTSPFVFLVRNVEALCHGFGTVGSRIKFDNMTANSYHTSGIDVSHRVRQLSLWVSCVNQFGKARISYQVKDSVGKSVHNYFLEYKAYRGGDRLLLEVSRSLKNVP